MKNYLVKTVFEVEEGDWHFRDRSNEENLYQNYLEMHRLSTASFTKHLKGNWELKFLGGKVKSINDAFEKTFHFIYKLWQEGDVNILYTDPDTLAVKDIDPWDISDRFMMFNFTDPRSHLVKNSYGAKFPYYFNAGVRLFPSKMDQKIWDIGLALAERWDKNSYDTEQVILNSMLWSQGLKLHQALNPKWCWQAQWLPDQAPLWYQNIWNGLDINKALIIHAHGSRNSDKKLSFMQQLSRGEFTP